MDNKEIQNLIKLVAKSGLSEVKIEKKDFKITIKNKPEFVTGAYANIEPVYTQPAIPAVPAPVQGTTQSTTPSSQGNEIDESKYVTIKAPIIGTFYRKPAPDKPPYVEVGDTIKEGDVVCIIEAMKLFNEIESEVSGKIVKVLVDDATPVEFDQPLFLVEPM